MVSRATREGVERIFRARGRPARLPKRLFFFAGDPRERRGDFSSSRANRDHVKTVFLIRGRPASVPRQFFSFAGLPRACRSNFSHLRGFREAPGGGRESLWFDVLFIGRKFSNSRYQSLLSVSHSSQCKAFSFIFSYQSISLSQVLAYSLDASKKRRT